MNMYYLLEVSKLVCHNALLSTTENDMSIKISLYKEALTKIIPIKNDTVKAYLFKKYSTLSSVQHLSKKERISKQKHDVLKQKLLAELENTKKELLRFEKPSLNTAKTSLSSTQYIHESRTYFKNVEIINSHIKKKETLLDQLDLNTSKLDEVVFKKKFYTSNNNDLKSNVSKTPIKRLSFRKSAGTLIYQAGVSNPNKRTYISPNAKETVSFAPITGTQVHISSLVDDAELLFRANA